MLYIQRFKIYITLFDDEIMNLVRINAYSPPLPKKTIFIRDLYHSVPKTQPSFTGSAEENANIHPANLTRPKHLGSILREV
jgi:hypothetical protein